MLNRKLNVSVLADITLILIGKTMFLVLSLLWAVAKLKSPHSHHRNVSEFIAFLLPDKQQTLFLEKNVSRDGQTGKR